LRVPEPFPAPRLLNFILNPLADKSEEIYKIFDSVSILYLRKTLLLLGKATEQEFPHPTELNLPCEPVQVKQKLSLVTVTT
jgi:hypothetical protein